MTYTEFTDLLIHMSRIHAQHRAWILDTLHKASLKDHEDPRRANRSLVLFGILLGIATTTGADTTALRTYLEHPHDDDEGDAMTTIDTPTTWNPQPINSGWTSAIRHILEAIDAVDTERTAFRTLTAAGIIRYLGGDFTPRPVDFDLARTADVDAWLKDAAHYTINGSWARAERALHTAWILLHPQPPTWRRAADGSAAVRYMRGRLIGETELLGYTLERFAILARHGAWAGDGSHAIVIANLASLVIAAETGAGGGWKVTKPVDITTAADNPAWALLTYFALADETPTAGCWKNLADGAAAWLDHLLTTGASDA